MNEYMQIALDEAQLAATEGEIPVGAAVFKDGKLIAKAHNLCEQMKNPMAHAEMLVIEAALKELGAKNLSECDLYVTLEPCPMCTGAIHYSKVKRLYFGAYDIKSGACGGNVDLARGNVFDYKTEIYGSIDEIRCRKILQDFFQTIRKERKNHVE